MSDNESDKKPLTEEEPQQQQPEPEQEATPAPAQQEAEPQQQGENPTAADPDFGEQVADVESEECESDGPPVEEHVNEMLSKDVPLKYVLSHINDSKTAKQLYRDLLIYIPFVIWFVFFAYYRRDTLEQHYTSSALEGVMFDYETPPSAYDVPLNATKGTEGRNDYPHFRKTYVDIDNPEDWNNWFQRVMIPVFYSSLNPTVEGYNHGPLGMNLNVGSLRVRAHKVRDMSCAVNDDFYLDNYTQTCWGEFLEDETMLTEKFAMTSTANFLKTANMSDPNITLPGPEGYWNYTDGCTFRGQNTQGWIGRYPCGGFIHDFAANLSFDEALTMAKKLENEGFLDHKSTRFIVVEFFTYNPALDIFTSGRMFHEVTAGGGWIPTRRFKSFTVWGPKKFTDGVLAFEFLFFVFVLYYFIRFFVLWVRHMRKTGKCMQYIFVFWNFLEGVNIFLFLVSFGLHWEWWSKSKHEDIKNMDLPNQALEYQETLNYIMEVYYLELYLLAINMVITVLLIMKYFQMNPRLNILTRTLEASAQSVVGVIIIFLLIVTSYALAGMVLFGHALYDFRNLSAAFTNLFLTLLGEFDYEMIRTENRGWTFMYFWTFIVISLFIMLNFITAIIGNGFDEEQAKTKTLPVEVQLRRMAISMQRFSIAERCSRLKDAFITRTRRLPDDILEDHLHELRRSLLMGDKISEEAVENGDADEPEYLITRGTFNEILPANDLENIGDDYLDNLFIELAEDYELFGVEDENEDEAKIIAAYEKGMQDGFVNVFINERETLSKAQRSMLSGSTEEDSGQVVVDGKRMSFRRLSRKSSKSSMATSEASSAASAEDETPKLTRFELLNKLLGEAQDDEVAKRKRQVTDELVQKPMIGGMSSGIANLRSRVSKIESTAEGINSLLNLTSHKLVKVIKK